MHERTYTIKRPRKWTNGVIFGSPHSGNYYPDWFFAETSLPINVLRSSEDAFVDKLIDIAPDFGAVALSARIPRSIIDLNRGAEEIDPLVVRGVPPHPLNQRTLAGLGVIPRVVSQGRQIHSKPIDRDEAERRINAYWRPYHRALSLLIAEAQAQFGQAILIDMHSMPHDAVNHLQGQRPHVVLGNRHGLSASARVLDAVASAIEDEGLLVRRNSPFSGAYICYAYGRPGKNTHVVQVEIDRTLYMHEDSITPRDDFDEFSALFSRIIQKLSAFEAIEGDFEPIAAQ